MPIPIETCVSANSELPAISVATSNFVFKISPHSCRTKGTSGAETEMLFILVLRAFAPVASWLNTTGVDDPGQATIQVRSLVCFSLITRAARRVRRRRQRNRCDIDRGAHRPP